MNRFLPLLLLLCGCAQPAPKVASGPPMPQMTKGITSAILTHQKAGYGVPVSQYCEYIVLTNRTPWVTNAVVCDYPASNMTVAISLHGLAMRPLIIEHSFDLATWQTWLVTNCGPFDFSLVIPFTQQVEFFRAKS
jgi:hypothetical protein